MLKAQQQRTQESQEFSQKNMPYWAILLNGAKYKVILQIWLEPETE